MSNLTEPALRPCGGGGGAKAARACWAASMKAERQFFFHQQGVCLCVSLCVFTCACMLVCMHVCLTYSVFSAGTSGEPASREPLGSTHSRIGNTHSQTWYVSAHNVSFHVHPFCRCQFLKGFLSDRCRLVLTAAVAIDSKGPRCSLVGI